MTLIEEFLSVLPMGGIFLFATLVFCFALAPSVASTREYRSLEVKHEFQRLHSCSATGQTTGRCTDTSRITSSRSRAVAPMRSRTFNGRRRRRRWQRISGCGKPAGARLSVLPVVYRLAATLLNVPLRLVPTVPMMVMAATAISAAINPYSIAVTPLSSLTRQERNFSTY